MANLKKGDIVLNGYAVPGLNDLHVIIGATTRKTGPHSVTKYYKTRMLFKGKLNPESCLFSQADHKLTKIGHVDYDAYIVEQMTKCRSQVDAQA